MSCTVMVYTPEGFLCGIFVAKKGEKMVYLYSVILFVCIYFAALCVCLLVSVVAFILQLFQVMCRC
jgi:hypothetical protein